MTQPAAADLREFLPAVLEITETPPSPAARAVLWTVGGFLAAALIWASLAHISIVAVAPGVVLAPGQARPVQAFEGGRVQAILVADGDRVVQGQPLVRLDPAIVDADMQIAKRQLDRAAQLAPIQRERAAGGAQLLALGHLARADYLLLEERRITAEQDLAAARHQLQKARERMRWHFIQAPAAGTVQQLALRSVGDVVQSGAVLMVVVPDGEGLEVEARLANRERGFVTAGQEAIVKVEAFPFTRFGSLRGTVMRVSSDAAGAPDEGSWYAVRVKLDDSVLRGDGFAHRVSPGMAVSVDVDTGERRVIDYFLGSLLEHTSQSMGER